jgi:hypothetical protein
MPETRTRGNQPPKDPHSRQAIQEKKALKGGNCSSSRAERMEAEEYKGVTLVHVLGKLRPTTMNLSPNYGNSTLSYALQLREWSKRCTERNYRICFSSWATASQIKSCKIRPSQALPWYSTHVTRNKSAALLHSPSPADPALVDRPALW